ncbi:MAG: class I SAM-dependent methyltransferase [Acidimicrobiales bacterium]
MSDRPGARRALRALVGRSPAADRILRRLRRTTALVSLQAEVRALRVALDAAERSGVSPSVAPFVTWVPPGHFYSPVPDMADLEARLDDLCDPDRDPAGVDLRTAEQLELFATLAALAREAPLAETTGTTARYGVENPSYGIGDASMLQAMLRHLRPRRYLEVGSGYTTALALDVNEQYLDGAMQVTAIEPYPELLRRVTRPSDALEIVGSPVQAVPLERFSELEAGDVCFIDSTHVLKAGSDVQYLFGRVLPALAAGVYVHVHDIFWPFEYLAHWIREGRAWNEAYLLQAFLSGSRDYEIVLWNHYLAMRHHDVIARELPAMLANTGGALWMRRRE